MKYEVGKTYEMDVAGIRVDSAGYNYIALYDDNPSMEYRVWNILKYQYDNLPDTIPVLVTNIDIYGRPKLKQDVGRLIQEHYKKGKPYTFTVIDIKEDYNTNKPYYLLEDDFDEHRYYFKGEQKWQKGEECILEVAGFTNKGDLKLREHHGPGEVENNTLTEDNNTKKRYIDSWDNLPVLEGLEESKTVELKTSIVYPANGNGEPNIDKQLFEILKELTAFMNTEGGTLYIGIHDKTKKVVGITNDFSHLNEGDDDYNGEYKGNIDSYQSKIRNKIDKLCPTLANNLIEFDFPELNEHIYCKITVKKAKRPIFINEMLLYVRQGNRKKLLKGDNITFFITDRMTISINEIIDTEDMPTVSTGMNLDRFKEVMRSLLNERKMIPAILPEPKDLGKIDYWIIWHNDATWKRSREKSMDENVHIQVPVYKNMSDPIVVFCYESGKINPIKLSVFRKGVNLNIIQKNGWSLNEKPKNIFIMHATDFLVGYSVDFNGTACVKLHSISDYSPKKSATNQGSPFLPDGWKTQEFATLGAEHKEKIKHLIVAKNQRSTNAGTPLNTANEELMKEIEYIKKTLSNH